MSLSLPLTTISQRMTLPARSVRHLHRGGLQGLPSLGWTGWTRDNRDNASIERKFNGSLAVPERSCFKAMLLPASRKRHLRESRKGYFQGSAMRLRLWRSCTTSASAGPCSTVAVLNLFPRRGLRSSLSMCCAEAPVSQLPSFPKISAHTLPGNPRLRSLAW